MRRVYFVIGFAAVLFIVPHARGAEEESGKLSQSEEEKSIKPLTLNDCYSLALEMSEDGKIQSEDIRIAEARYRRSLASFSPEIGLFAAKNWQDTVDPNRDPVRNQEPTLQNLSNPSSYYSNYFRSTPTTNPFLGGVSFRLPLFNGFRVYEASEAALSDLEAKRNELKRFRELLYMDVAEIYYQILQYEKTLEILSLEEKTLGNRIAELKRYVRLGRSRKGDLLSSRSDYAATLAEKQGLQAIYSSSKELMAFVTGKKGEEIILAKAAESPAVEKIEAYLSEVGERKDILAAVSRFRSTQHNLAASQAGHHPNISLDGNYYLSQKPDTGRDWNINLRIDLPIFQGGKTHYEIEESKGKVRISELELSRLRRSADYDVRTAYTDFVSALSQVLFLREAFELSRDAYDAQRQDYSLGVVRNLEVLDSMRKMHQTRRNLIRMEMLSRIAEVRLHLASGKEVLP